MPALLNNPAHWHLRAEEARLLAAQLVDPEAKATILKMAEEYDRLAARALARMARRPAGIDGLHFHDLRGTAITMLTEAGCTIPEIAAITGHSLKHVTHILETYLSRTRQLADAAIIKLDRYSIFPKSGLGRHGKIEIATRTKCAHPPCHGPLRRDSTTDRAIARVDSYDALIAPCRARVQALGINYAILDAAAGFTDGYTAKLLGHSEHCSTGGRRTKQHFSPTSFDAYLGALGGRPPESLHGIQADRPRGADPQRRFGLIGHC
jgi:hypothetical protein